MKKTLFILVLILVTCNAWSQEANSNAYSSAPDTARYEIVNVGETFKIDKYSGKVYLLSEKENGDFYWKLMLMKTHTQDSITEDKVNYQISTSWNRLSKVTFLLNVNNGKIWKLEKVWDGLFWTQM